MSEVAGFIGESSPKRQRVDEKFLWRLTTVDGIDAKYNKNCVTFSMLMSGDWSAATLFSFTWDLDWIIEECPRITKGFPVTLVEGSENLFQQLSDFCAKHKHLNVLGVKTPQYGSHHTKMIILEFESGVRIGIFTANLEKYDWAQKSQGVWWQDFPYSNQRSDEANEKNDHANDFGEILVNYLKIVSRNCKNGLQNLIQRIEGLVDFSDASVALVPSAPGDRKNWTHAGKSLNENGLGRMSFLLSKEPWPPKIGAKETGTLVCQCSSIGSLNANWLNAFKRHLLPDAKFPEDNGLQIIWPSVASVRNSLEGWAAGGSIPAPHKNIFDPKTKKLKETLSKSLCKWKGNSIYGRDCAMPHIKSYFRYFPNRKGSGVLWFLLTSANMSTTAWGLKQKDNALSIKSFELGVLFVPSLLKRPKGEGVEFSVDPGGPLEDFKLVRRGMDDAALESGIPMNLLPIPYVVPPKVFDLRDGDEPWTVDVPRTMLDSHGSKWMA